MLILLIGKLLVYSGGASGFTSGQETPRHFATEDTPNAFSRNDSPISFDKDFEDDFNGKS